MSLPPFALERYFAQYEFDVPYLLCSSDCESLRLSDLLALEPGSQAALNNLWLGYTESAGDPDLRAAIAQLYTHIAAEQVLVHSGAEEAIFTFMQALLTPGDHIIVHWPGYQSLAEVARSLGAEVTLWRTHPEQNWALDLNFLQDNLKANTKAIVVNCPHNPTGYLMTPETMTALNQIAQERELVIFSDEVYRLLEHDAQNRLPAFCDLNERAVSLGVMSKAFGLAGLRIGWLATRNTALLADIARVKDYTTICNSAPSEFLARLALRHQDKILARNRAIIAENLALLGSFFDDYADTFTWQKPIAGPIAFPALKQGKDASPFAQKLVEAEGVLLLPGHVYDPAYVAHFRLGFGRENLPQALEGLGRFLARGQ